jgi:hypothetical protein
MAELFGKEDGGIDRRMVSKTVDAYGQWLAIVLIVPIAVGGSPPTSRASIPPSPFAPWQAAQCVA